MNINKISFIGTTRDYWKTIGLVRLPIYFMVVLFAYAILSAPLFGLIEVLAILSIIAIIFMDSRFKRVLKMTIEGSALEVKLMKRCFKIEMNEIKSFQTIYPGWLLLCFTYNGKYRKLLLIGINDEKLEKLIHIIGEK